MKIVKMTVKILAVVALLFATTPTKLFAEDLPSISVVSANSSPKTDEVVTFSVNLKDFDPPSDNLASFEMKLAYDPTYWEAQSTSTNLGSFLSGISEEDYQMPVNSIDQETGTIHFALSIFNNSEIDYFSGDGTLFTFDLKAKKNGETDISFLKSLVVQISRPGQNVSHSTTDAAITIGGTQSQQPAPSPPTTTPDKKEFILADVHTETTEGADGKTIEITRLEGENAKNTIQSALQSGAKTVVIKLNKSSNQIDLERVIVSKDTASKLSESSINLMVESRLVKLLVPVETLKTFDENELVFEISKDKTKTLLIKDFVPQAKVLGSTVKVTTSLKDKVLVTLPVDSSTTEVDGLSVFIDHSDEEVEVKSGEIVYDSKNTPVGLSVSVDKFSTFTVISNNYTKVEYLDDESISNYAYDAVYKAQELGIMVGSGSPIPTFNPKENLTRAQFTKVILRLLNQRVSNTIYEQEFTDLPTNHWAFGYIMKAKELGIIKGISEDKFNPNDPITRQQMALMIGRAFKLQSESSTVTFVDQNRINKEALPYIQALSEQGVMKGSNGLFNPNHLVTREMAAIVAVRLIEK